MVNRKIQIINTSAANTPLLDGIFCQSFICRLRGLMFRRSINDNFGLLLADSAESRINSAIHMFFMNFDIAVIWMDRNFQVVDVRIAKKGHAFYAPIRAAKYTLETDVLNFAYFHASDQIKVIYVD